MQKIKNILTKFLNICKSIADDGGKPKLHCSLFLIFLLSLWTVVFQMVAQRFNILQLYPPILLLNAIPIFLIICILYFIIGKISVSYIATQSVLAILLLVNHFKVKLRDEPLNPTDFSLGKEATNIIQNYDLSIDLTVILTIGLCAISFWIVAKNIKNKRPKIWVSILGIIITSALSVGAYNTIYTNTKVYNNLLSSLGIYHESTIVSSKGLVYSLLNGTTVMTYEMPDGYSTEKAKEILNRYPDNTLSENTPNVIAVMGEAFSDIQKWERVRFTDDNPYEYYNKLKRKGAYGKLFVPGFAGATASTEFEFITGNNTSAISTAMPTAYKTLITSPAYSIAREFKKQNFSASFMHPGYSWFYNRQNVYDRLGFDSFYSRDDLTGDVPSTSTYANDTVSADMIINDYNKHLAENPNKGYLSFTVTIQNHGPYSDSRLLYDKEYIAKTEDMTDAEYYIINNYLGGIKSANDFLEQIYDYINTLDEPTVLLFFGDHLPFLDSEEMIYQRLGLDIVSNSYEAYENRYSTDYLIVGNQKYLQQSRPKLRGKQSEISANYLSVKLFEYMNEELPQYQAFLKDMMQVMPIVSKNHNGESGTEFNKEMSEEQLKFLDEYKILQYYNIKDYKKGERR